MKERRKRRGLVHAKSSVTQREVAAAREHAPPQRRWENPTVSVNAKLGGRGEAEKLEKKVWHSSSYTEVTVDLTFVALSAEEREELDTKARISFPRQKRCEWARIRAAASNAKRNPRGPRG